MKKSLKIKNPFKEDVDVLVEGSSQAKKTIVFVHGFGTDKNENYSFQYDIAQALAKDFRIVRFDLTGYGKSEGKQEENNYKKHAKDLEAILKWVKTEWGNNIYVLAHSMGCFIASLLCPDNIQKTVFTSIPNANANYIINWMQANIKKRSGGVVNEKGISLYPRSRNRGIQKLGPSFWQVLREFKPVDSIKKFAKKTNLIIFKPLQDEVCGNKYFKDYKKISQLKFIELQGKHNFIEKKNRDKLILEIKRFFLFK